MELKYNEIIGAIVQPSVASRTPVNLGGNSGRSKIKSFNQ